MRRIRHLVEVDAGVEKELLEDLRVEDLAAVEGKRHAHPVVVAIDPVALRSGGLEANPCRSRTGISRAAGTRGSFPVIRRR